MLTRAQRDAFLSLLKNDLDKDFYHDCSIYTTYLDTDGMDLMRLCEDKPDYREKLRIRSYHASPKDDDEIFLELKQKILGTSCKRREAFSWKDLQAFLKDPKPQSQIQKELARALKQYDVHPVMSLRVHRLCYVWKEDINLRITLDDSLFARTEHFGFQADEADQPLLDKDEFILEIKSPGYLPYKLIKVLQEIQAQPAPFSKAGRVYANIMEQKKQAARQVPAHPQQSALPPMPRRAAMPAAA